MTPRLNVSSLVCSLLCLSQNDGSVWLGSARKAAESKVCHLAVSGNTPCRLVAAAATRCRRRLARVTSPFASLFPASIFGKALRQIDWAFFFKYVFLFVCFIWFSKHERFFPHMLTFSNGSFVLWHFRLMLMFCNSRTANWAARDWRFVARSTDSHLNYRLAALGAKKCCRLYYFFPTWWCENCSK